MQIGRSPRASDRGGWISANLQFAFIILHFSIWVASESGIQSDLRNTRRMKRKILVVEDDPHIRLGLCDALTGEGYDVIECGDGAQAMPLLRQRRPDLLVLDLMLPHKSGYDLCRDIRSEKNRVPILILSAKGQEIDKVVGLELGADDYVVKPFSLRELLARVRALIRRAEPAGESAAPLAPEIIQFADVEIDPRA